MSVTILRRWEKLSRFVPAHRTLGWHRRSSVEQCNAYRLLAINLLSDSAFAHFSPSDADGKSEEGALESN